MHLVTRDREPPKLASLSHYPGGVRAQNLAQLDRYLLKSLDTIVDGIELHDVAAVL